MELWQRCLIYERDEDSGVEWIGKIPHSWNIVQTKRFFQNSKRVVGDNVDKYERFALTLNGIIKRDKNDSDGLQPKKFESYQILEKNELVFKLIDLENVKTSRVGLSQYTGLVSPAYIVLRNKSDDNRYFYYWFIFMYYNEIFNHLSGDGVRSTLNEKDLISLLVPAIVYKIQYHISNYLDIKCAKIYAIIEREQAVIEKLKEYKLSIINETIVEVEGDMCHLGYIATMKNGVNFSSNTGNKTIKFLGVGDFKYYFVLDRKDMFSNIIIDDDIADDYLLKSGDIVFVRSNGSKELIGHSIIVENIDFPLTYSGFCIRFRNNRTDCLNDMYLLYFFRSPYFRKQLEKCSQGSNISNINQDLLSQISIIIPSMCVQLQAVEKITQLCGRIDSVISRKQSVIDKLTEYKKFFIYEVVTGKKEV